jgi:hypothetical protein
MMPNLVELDPKSAAIQWRPEDLTPIVNTGSELKSMGDDSLHSMVKDRDRLAWPPIGGREAIRQYSQVVT